ncbi:hypothetical protein, partial [Sansalvadorimonas verongulae]|uniref:hypothetical protein n=1 Tax=Sansalvadorimonas verongulae TaxID=2172824 RepID=UPI0018AD2CA4
AGSILRNLDKIGLLDCTFLADEINGLAKYSASYLKSEGFSQKQLARIWSAAKCKRGKNSEDKKLMQLLEPMGEEEMIKCLSNTENFLWDFHPLCLEGLTFPEGSDFTGIDLSRYDFRGVTFIKPRFSQEQMESGLLVEAVIKDSSYGGH